MKRMNAPVNLDFFVCDAKWTYPSDVPWNISPWLLEKKIDWFRIFDRFCLFLKNLLRTRECLLNKNRNPECSQVTKSFFQLLLEKSYIMSAIFTFFSSQQFLCTTKWVRWMVEANLKFLTTYFEKCIKCADWYRTPSSELSWHHQGTTQ